MTEVVAFNPPCEIFRQYLGAGFAELSVGDLRIKENVAVDVYKLIIWTQSSPRARRLVCAVSFSSPIKMFNGSFTVGCLFTWISLSDIASMVTTSLA